METWEYDSIRIDWIKQEKVWRTRLPNGEQSDEKQIRDVLNYWGAED